METGASAQVDKERMRRMRRMRMMRMRIALLMNDTSKAATGVRSLGRHTSRMASDTQVSRRDSGSHHE